MKVQQDIAKAAAAAVAPLRLEIERLEREIVRKRERGENYERELEAIDSNRADIVRIQKPYVEMIHMMAPAPVVVRADRIDLEQPFSLKGSGKGSDAP